MHVVLFEPQIPPNTGNVIRLCANTGAELHLVGRLGFSLDDANLRRAGLDYHELARVRTWNDLDQFFAAVAPDRVMAFSTRGHVRHTQVTWQPGDAMLFGPETRGLPAELLDGLPPDQRVRLPMVPGNRSLNLSNAVAVAVYEAWRQQGFPGSAPS